MVQKSTPSSFQELHSAFVTTENGTTLAELVQLLGSISLLPILIPLLIPWIVPRSFVKQAVSSREFFILIRAILEYPVLTIPAVLIITLFAGDKLDSTRLFQNSGVVLVTLFCTAVGIIVVNHAITAPKWFGMLHQWEKIKDLPTGWSGRNLQQNENKPLPKKKVPFITNYRAIVIYITVLCILAVDFAIFPRRFAKTKTYGISLMDVGTGCFVFANGIVAPEARNKQSPLSSSLKSTIPIVVLGFVRLISVKGIEYQEVVEEYGVHWNFFFTLAGVKLLSSLLFARFNPSNGLKISAAVCVLYELILSYNDLQDKYILNPNIDRNGNIINANREGIFSVAGYLSIYLASVYFGKIITWKDRTSVRDWLVYAAQSFLQIFVLWGLYLASTTLWNPPCRRTANASYVLLMIALNYSLLWFQMFLALVQVCLQHIGLIYGPMLFYELNDHNNMQASRIQNLQRLSKDFTKVKKQSDDISRGDDVDMKLKHLEKRLNAALREMKSGGSGTSSRLELFQEIMAIENEMDGLEKRLCKGTSDEEDETGNGELERRRNLVLLPDLSRSPVTLEAICYNGLAVFLFGNLLTGLINCLIYTMYAPVFLSLCYLWFYVTALYAISLALYWYQIQLKFW